jgi:hypothetical protein
MALTGQLSDMSLAELIEFFCNQRKTGRLKIDYQRGHSVFFIREGELVDAKVGALSGPEAVYFSLTLPNAAFDFSPDVQATRRTINEKWTQVVLEGLRRLDEGLSPTEADAFGGWSPSDADLAQMLDQVEHLDSSAKSQKARARSEDRARRGRAVKADVDDGSPSTDAAQSAEPFSMMIESAGAAAGLRRSSPWAVAAAVVLACAVAAVPFMKRSGAPTKRPPRPSPPQPVTPAERPSPPRSFDRSRARRRTPRRRTPPRSRERRRRATRAASASGASANAGAKKRPRRRRTAANGRPRRVQARDPDALRPEVRARLGHLRRGGPRHASLGRGHDARR